MAVGPGSRSPDHSQYKGMVIKTREHQSRKQRFQGPCLCAIAHTLYINYVTDTFLLVSSSVSGKQLLCFVQGQDQNRNEQKHSTKNFAGFHNHILL